MNVYKQRKNQSQIFQESKADEYVRSPPSHIAVGKVVKTAVSRRLKAKESQSSDPSLSRITPRTRKKERKEGYFFDLHLPTHEVKTPISQLSMDEIDWMEDLYKECLERTAPKEHLRLGTSIDNDIAAVMEDILVSTRHKSCLSPQMKRSPILYENQKSDSNQQFPSIFDSSRSLLIDCQNDFPNVSDYLESPEWKGHEKLLIEWRNFFSDNRSAFAKEKRKVMHGQMHVEFPCLNVPSDCEKRTSKLKSHRVKRSTEGNLQSERKESRCVFPKFTEDM
jgi:hypothetical protein